MKDTELKGKFHLRIFLFYLFIFLSEQVIAIWKQLIILQHAVKFYSVIKGTDKLYVNLMYNSSEIWKLLFFSHVVTVLLGIVQITLFENLWTPEQTFIFHKINAYIYNSNRPENPKMGGGFSYLHAEPENGNRLEKSFRRQYIDQVLINGVKDIRCKCLDRGKIFKAIWAVLWFLLWCTNVYVWWYRQIINRNMYYHIFISLSPK